MALSTVNKHSFRFLDLPADLRCCVYDNIEFPTTWYTLDRAQAFIGKQTWPVPPKLQVYDSRINLIRPHTAVATDILTTCRLINREARPILRRRMEHCRVQPLRYLVDFSAAHALLKPCSALPSCLEMPIQGFENSANEAVKSFLQLCKVSLSQMRRARSGSQNGSRDIRVIELTITHKTGVVYGMEVFQAVWWMSELKYYGPTRLVFIYKSPLPSVNPGPGKMEVRDLGEIEESYLGKIPVEPRTSDHTTSSRGIFVRPLEEEAFKKHVEGLEWY